MNLNAFKHISVQRTDRSVHSARINPDHINHIVPSKTDQVGRSILTMADGLAGHSRIAPTEDLSTLAQLFSTLTPVQVFDTPSGKATTGGLVNMARVALIEEKAGFATLVFVDGTDLNIAKAWS